MVATLVSDSLRAMVVIAGPTASGKTSLGIDLAEWFGGEIVSCDSVAVYRGMEIGTAKPSMEERERVPHHLIDVAWPDEPYTAGEYSRDGRGALAEISARGCVPMVTGGTGLYLRALVEGLFPAPEPQPELRERLRGRVATHGSRYLHRMLRRLDASAALAIHENDAPKITRAIEVSLAARRPMTELWQQGRDALSGYRVLRVGLNPPRAALYERINARAAAMFARGLVEETRGLLARYGPGCRALGSLGYAEAGGVLRGELTVEAAVARSQQGHRNYAKRQITWFRRDAEMRWLNGFGDEAGVVGEAVRLVEGFLRGGSE